MEENKRKREETDEYLEDIDNNSPILLDREEDINAFRNKLSIKVKGNNVETPCGSFNDMKISKSLNLKY